MTPDAAPSATPGTKRVFFHVGAPKTGTTYLQHVLFQNRERLAQDGVLFPYTTFAQSFRSAQDFKRAGWGNHGPERFEGEWADVADRVRAWDGDTVLLSNELLGLASSERIAEGVARIQPCEVQVVFTARDLARQLVSDWQEQVKHRHSVTLESFVDDLVELGQEAPAPFGTMFWGLHDAAQVLARWSQVVPAANVHVITVPQPGAPSDTLWRRFCTVTGLDPKAYDTVTKRANSSLGVVEAEFLRRVNSEIAKMPPEDYDPLVRRYLAPEVLGRGSVPITLPQNALGPVERRSRRLVDELAQAGYQVEGDLEELMPRPEDHAAYTSPTQLTDADLAPAAFRASVGMLRRSARLRRKVAQLTTALEAQPDPAEPTPTDRAREAARRARGLARRLASRLRRVVRT
ncbi:MAG: hypothetical protein ACRDQA_05890 [Nocardioidaceae bacterium]